MVILYLAIAYVAGKPFRIQSVWIFVKIVTPALQA